jgi:membrane protease YdiL (CAAX protease family)
VQPTSILVRPSPSLPLAVVVAAGCAALLARPWLVGGLADPTAALVVLFVALGVVGVAWPLPALPTTAVQARLSPALVLGVGLVTFAAGRLLAGGPDLVTPLPLLARAAALNGLAAVAEEAFFRRLLYGALEHRWPNGVVAVTVSAAAFAAVHVTVWGWWVLPLDLAAGLVLSWQRAASGSWTVPAATHVAANLWALT